MFLSGPVCKAHDCFLEFPGIQTELILMDIGEPDPLHLLFQEFTGVKFRLRSRRAVAENRIALKFLHLFRKAVGVSDIHCLQIYFFELPFVTLQSCQPPYPTSAGLFPETGKYYKLRRILLTVFRDADTPEFHDFF